MHFLISDGSAFPVRNGHGLLIYLSVSFSSIPLSLSFFLNVSLSGKSESHSVLYGFIAGILDTMVTYTQRITNTTVTVIDSGTIINAPCKS